MTTSQKSIFLALALLFCGTALYILRDHKRTQDDFETLLAGKRTGLIEKLEISGQMRHITVSDPEAIAAFESAFVKRSETSSTNRLEGGILYELNVKFKSGGQTRTDVYFYEDRSGFDIADMFHLNAGDPQMTEIRFPQPLDNHLQTLLDSLLPAK